MLTTVKQEIAFVGTGLHSGRPVRMLLRPAATGGIRFRRTDVTDRDNVIPARYDRVSDTRLNTRLTNAAGVSVATVEHLMAALAGTGVWNAIVDIDGPEVPIMDGSSRRFVQKIVAAGLRHLPGPQRAIRVLETVRAFQDGAWAELAPAPALSIAFEIDFDEAAIGRQAKTLDMVNGVFVRELADCRTFCRRADVEAMQAAGLALGGSLDSAVVVDGDKVLNPEGLRRSDEFVRHKMLDALGDLALAGAPVLGAYRGVRAGHGLSNALLRRLFATQGAWAEVALDADTARQLPGAGVVAADLLRTG
ncbi:MAG: UDP-3-O-acyl-N-acetylglucosamine deacetylase [Rhodobacteraceae bacterium]|nr:UDP-3-O-acyl-N-acetylglucosamine deacetylase [Paracoccaceae bacterium]